MLTVLASPIVLRHSPGVQCSMKSTGRFLFPAVGQRASSLDQALGVPGHCSIAHAQRSARHTRHANTQIDHTFYSSVSRTVLVPSPVSFRATRHAPSLAPAARTLVPHKQALQARVYPIAERGKRVRCGTIPYGSTQTSKQALNRIERQIWTFCPVDVCSTCSNGPVFSSPSGSGTLLLYVLSTPSKNALRCSPCLLLADHVGRRPSPCCCGLDCAASLRSNLELLLCVQQGKQGVKKIGRAALALDLLWHNDVQLARGVLFAALVLSRASVPFDTHSRSRVRFLAVLDPDETVKHGVQGLSLLSGSMNRSGIHPKKYPTKKALRCSQRLLCSCFLHARTPERLQVARLHLADPVQRQRTHSISFLRLSRTGKTGACYAIRTRSKGAASKPHPSIYMVGLFSFFSWDVVFLSHDWRWLYA